ncbi:galactose-3-O-sulfotransferase 3 [Trichomycterus rosablanca]|uniref:galactose-3-O-sulfotransferase 3 n=1 Tax=Trichomycterus rosablanca TaxID=2290929 RepID=UPI002F357701
MLESYQFSCSSPSSRSAKHTSVVFLKTHKTASSTVQNILFRFAERNNLTVALPVPACDHQFCYPQLFSTRFVYSQTIPPDIVTNHLRFSRSELRRIMPNNTIYITILREPGAMFESLFSYYSQYCESFRRVPNCSLEAFLDQPWAYYRPDEKDSMYARNTLTFDLGGDKDRSPADAATYAKRFAAEVERVFSLVMIAEYFDESLVLLRHRLSWDLEDLLYINQNMRSPSSKGNLSEAFTAKIRAWNSIDAVLYDHFNASLWRQLRELGLGCVAKEVQLLRRARDHVVRGCFGGSLPRMRSAKQIANKELRPWQPNSKVAIVGYELPLNATNRSRMTQDMCMKMIMPELQYTSQLMRSQSLRYRSRLHFAATQRLQKPLQNNRQYSGQSAIVWHTETSEKSSRTALQLFHLPAKLLSNN